MLAAIPNSSIFFLGYAVGRKRQPATTIKEEGPPTGWPKSLGEAASLIAKARLIIH